MPRIERLAGYAPAVFAVFAAVTVVPASTWLASRLSGASEAAAPIGAAEREEESYARKDEPLRPAPRPVGLDGNVVALGRALFHEPALSRTGAVSCATCHDVESGGDDGLRVSEGVNGIKGSVNAPTVLNAALNFRQFWDGRAGTLEEQAEGPIHSPSEMNSDWGCVLEYLRSNAAYSDWFEAAFEDGVTSRNVVHAIAEYERALVTPDSPFDRWLRGDSEALTEEQLRGYQLFKANRCVGCHQGANVGGNLYQPLGVMVDYFDGGVDEPRHLGRFNVTGDPDDRHVFKVPGLRNVSRTAPYFHDGSAARLEDAVRVMLIHQVGAPADDDVVEAICRFLESLSALPQGAAL